MAFQDVQESGAHKFENQGDKLTGYYIGHVDFEGKYGPTTKYCFVTVDGERKDIIGQKFLKGILPNATPGLMTEVTFTGYKPSGKGNPTKTYKVRQDKDDTADVSHYNLGGADNNESNEPSGYQSAGEDLPEETSFDRDDQQPDEQPTTRASAPKMPAKSPSPVAQQKVKDLLKARKSA